MTSELTGEIFGLIESTLSEKIENFVVHLHEGNKKGVGYLGNLCFISLSNRNTSEETHLVLKQVLSSGGSKSLDFNSTVFHNELLFYGKIWPYLKDFQKFTEGKVFDKIPKCLALTSEKGSEKLILENLNFQSFYVCDKTVPLDKNHLAYIFKTFGQFHAISFACRALNQEKFAEMTELLKDIFDYFLNGTLFFKNSMKRCFGFIRDNLDSNNLESIANRLSKYVEDGPGLYSTIMKYEGQNQVLLHGDCWSNNFMFRADEHGNVADIKLIDFQMIRMGTPVFDLSYCFYSSASNEALEELDFYLQLYHDNLCRTLRSYGCNADEIFSFRVLKDEWKEHCKFGFMMAMMCWEQKLRYDVGVRDLSKIMDGDKTEMQKPRLFNAEKYNEITRNVVIHMYHNDFL